MCAARCDVTMTTLLGLLACAPASLWPHHHRLFTEAEGRDINSSPSICTSVCCCLRHGDPSNCPVCQPVLIDPFAATRTKTQRHNHTQFCRSWKVGRLFSCDNNRTPLKATALRWITQGTPSSGRRQSRGIIINNRFVIVFKVGEVQMCADDFATNSAITVSKSAFVLRVMMGMRLAQGQGRRPGRILEGPWDPTRQNTISTHYVNPELWNSFFQREFGNQRNNPDFPLLYSPVLSHALILFQYDRLLVDPPPWTIYVQRDVN